MIEGATGVRWPLSHSCCFLGNDASEGSQGQFLTHGQLRSQIAIHSFLFHSILSFFNGFEIMGNNAGRGSVFCSSTDRKNVYDLFFSAHNSGSDLKFGIVETTNVRYIGTLVSPCPAPADLIYHGCQQIPGSD